MGAQKSLEALGKYPPTPSPPLPTSWWACLEPCNVSGTMIWTINIIFVSLYPFTLDNVYVLYHLVLSQSVLFL